ncbi:polysaccharide deacetylase family protein [Candidatus Saccharibacteria bacterium]|nr:polysaccharide deacetylase family protein [Candidatus Saccharibacteria bacterium]
MKLKTNQKLHHSTYYAIIGPVLLVAILVLGFEVLALKPIFKIIQSKYQAKDLQHHYSKTSTSPAVIMGVVAEPVANVPINSSIHLPILLYHKTPANFDFQMKHLVDTGYTPVFMQEVYMILTGKVAGPAKPVAITFDDGFSDQLKATEVLKKYNFKSTFYVLIGGELSTWCIGAGRTATTCGDSYLNWEQLKSLQGSGLIEIGSHSVDHFQLAGLSETAQRFQIFESKRILEQNLGVAVLSFCYPYGNYNAITERLAKEAGYNNATTVAGSEYQNPSLLFRLNRIRDTKDLR